MNKKESIYNMIAAYQSVIIIIMSFNNTNGIDYDFRTRKTVYNYLLPKNTLNKANTMLKNFTNHYKIQFYFDQNNGYMVKIFNNNCCYTQPAQTCYLIGLKNCMKKALKRCKEFKKIK